MLSQKAVFPSILMENSQANQQFSTHSLSNNRHSIAGFISNYANHSKPANNGNRNNQQEFSKENTKFDSLLGNRVFAPAGNFSGIGNYSILSGTSASNHNNNARADFSVNHGLQNTSNICNQYHSEFGVGVDSKASSVHDVRYSPYRYVQSADVSAVERETKWDNSSSPNYKSKDFEINTNYSGNQTVDKVISDAAAFGSILRSNAIPTFCGCQICQERKQMHQVGDSYSLIISKL